MDSVERVKFDLNVKNTALVFEGLRFSSHLDDLNYYVFLSVFEKGMYSPHRKT